MDEGQPTALPKALVVMTANGYQWATSESNINRQLNDYFKACDPNRVGYTTYCTRHSFKLYLHAADAKSMDILYLAGWAGDNGQSQMLKHYGRQGIGSTEMVKRLEMAVSKAMGFLNENNEKVIQLYKA